MTIQLIEGFDELSKQHLFDMAAKHVIAQGKPGKGEQGCSYVAGCAASVFIETDDRRRADVMGGWKWIDKTSDHEENFVNKIQKCHDDATAKVSDESFVEDFKRRMLALAESYDLNPMVLV